MFDGPIRFTRHFSPTVGRLTNINDERLYSTWKMYLRRVRLYFGDTVQHWNRDYRAAQTIFQGPTSLAVRSTIQAGHAMLYARSTTNGFGVVDGFVAGAPTLTPSFAGGRGPTLPLLLPDPGVLLSGGREPGRDELPACC